MEQLKGSKWKHLPKVCFPLCAEQVCESSRLELFNKGKEMISSKMTSVSEVPLVTSGSLTGLADREPNPGYGEDEAKG